jgi:hypothetical protein
MGHRVVTAQLKRAEKCPFLRLCVIKPLHASMHRGGGGGGAHCTVRVNKKEQDSIKRRRQSMCKNVEGQKIRDRIHGIFF